MKCTFPFAKEWGSIGPDTPEEVSPPSTRSLLATWGIMLAGLSNAGRGYYMHRPRPAYHHLLVTISGRGRVWTNAGWTDCPPGMAYLSPAKHPSAFETYPRRRWQFVWVFMYETGNPWPEEFATRGSSIVRAEAKPLAAAVEGIYHEGIGHADARLIEYWARLIHEYATRLVRPHPTYRIDPLAQLWGEVAARPAADWSLELLAERAGVSRETLRKLCLAHHGQSPVEHVIHLRMRRADTLLQSAPAKLEVIARLVGYQNVFAFSTAFRRVHGVPPSTRRRMPS